MKEKKELYSPPRFEIVKLDLERIVVTASQGTGDGVDQNNDDLNNPANWS